MSQSPTIPEVVAEFKAEYVLNDDHIALTNWGPLALWMPTPSMPLLASRHITSTDMRGSPVLTHQPSLLTNTSLPSVKK